MSEEDIRDQQIERYVHGNLSEHERTEFEQRMTADESLRVRVSDEMEFLALYDKDLIGFKKKLESIQADRLGVSSTSVNKNGEGEAASSPPVEPGQVIRMRYIFAVAATVALLIGIFWFFNRPPDLQQLAMNAAKESFETTRGSEDELTVLFNSGEYQKYIERARAILKDSAEKANSSALIVGMARCEILLNRPSEAVALLKSLPEVEQQNCNSQFLSAMALLEIKDKENAERSLNNVIENRCYPLSDKARELVREIR